MKRKPKNGLNKPNDSSKVASAEAIMPYYPK